MSVELNVNSPVSGINSVARRNVATALSLRGIPDIQDTLKGLPGIFSSPVAELLAQNETVSAPVAPKTVEKAPAASVEYPTVMASGVTGLVGNPTMPPFIRGKKSNPGPLVN